MEAGRWYHVILIFVFRTVQKIFGIKSICCMVIHMCEQIVMVVKHGLSH
jgi:hypothetical protein